MFKLFKENEKKVLNLLIDLIINRGYVEKKGKILSMKINVNINNVN